jgi:hypothetical protein
MGVGEFFGGHILAGHTLDHLRAGNEHLGAARLNDEIGQRRAVGRAARAGAQDEGDLGHRAGKHDVGVKDLPIAGERIDALLHARAARIVHEDERGPGLQRLHHDLGDFDGVDLAGRPAGDREVLTGQVHQASPDGGGAGDHAIGRHTLALHSEEHGTMLGEQPGLIEALRIEQSIDSLARRQLTRFALLFQFFRATAENNIRGALLQFLHSPAWAFSINCCHVLNQSL